jgi:probable O-glycosylation ligase (exosortase A-associated)
MRDITIVLLFAAAAVAGLRRPYYAALIWVWFGLMNPHRLAYGFAYSLPFAQVAVVVIVVSAMFHARDIKWPRGAPILLLIALIVWMGLTTFNAILPEAAWDKYVEVLKALGLTIVVACLIHTREHIIGLVWTVVASLAFFGTKGGIFTIATGGAYRVWGPTSSVVEGNNELAVALIVTIPLMYFLTSHAREARDFYLVSWISERWLKRGLVVSMVLCAASALGSQSRGALLGILAMGAMLWWRSRSKLRLALVFFLAVAVAIPMLPDSWFERMETIQTYQEDESAMGRINAWEMAVNIANDRVLGAGFPTANNTVFGRYSPRSGPEWILVAHSIYFQILGEHGYIGLGLYLAFWISTYWMAGRLVRLGRQRDDLAWAATLGNMCKVSMVGFAAGAAFLSLAYWDMPFYIMVMVVVTYNHARAQLAAEPAPGVLVPQRAG